MPQEDEIYVQGEQAGSHDPKPLYEADRRCSQPGCKTTLSRYNGSDRCSLHPRHKILDGLRKRRRR